MTLRGNWTCPYCGFVNTRIVEEPGDLAAVRCDLDLGGCDKLVVLDVQEVVVLFRVRRVEGEWTDEQPAMPGVPVPMVAASAVDVDLEPEAHPEPLQAAANGDTPGFAFKWKGFYNEVKKMQEGRSFSELPKSTRQGLIEACGREIAAYLHQPPTMLQWDTYSPMWMPSGSGVANTYLSTGWKAAAERWHLQAKGLAT